MEITRRVRWRRISQQGQQVLSEDCFTPARPSAILLSQLYKLIPMCLKHLLRTFLTFVALISISDKGFASQASVKIARHVWSALSLQEQQLIQNKGQIQIIESDSYGLIIDNQGVNESTQSTNGGAALGAAVGSAVYVDKAIGNGNYSAKSQLAAILVGGILGSALDSQGVTRYHFRYAVKLGSGELKYFDQMQSDPFRHANGACVSVSNFSLIEQQLCSQSVEMVRSVYLTAKSTTGGVATGISGDVAGQQVKQERISCKLGTQAPVFTTREKCLSINGSIEE
ncbi:hypothetical protein [Undibacterium sp. TJN19]|uniref:hypothetical protein n=1 Tax=Undibacterium sp. TJN19 TaxID=3413055 RepID=UPI003BF16CEE